MIRFGAATLRAAARQRGPASRPAWRNNSTRPDAPRSKIAPILGVLGVAGLVGGISYYHVSTQTNSAGEPLELKEAVKAAGQVRDYQAVYHDIVNVMDAEDYDDGSFGPVLLRLAWHTSGTYDALTGTGGSNGATMRFAPEGDHGANAGLRTARNVLEKVHERHPWISFSDLWTLAGVVAIQEMSGGECLVPWRPGRQDRDVSFCTPDGRLPDGALGQDHLRSIFYRMGFDDREIVALSGAHALGRCHSDRSGFDGPWTFSPTVLTNDYYKLLMNEAWAYKKWQGPKQFEDVSTKSLMMLPTDMALIKDKKLRPFVERYAKDQDLFYKEFSDVFVKLIELGVPFEDDAKPVELKAVASA